MIMEGAASSVEMPAERSFFSARYCGRDFSTQEIARIRCLIASHPDQKRAGLSRLVCDALGWLRPDGRRKDMSCRVAMLRMQRDGLIVLPPPQQRSGNRHRRPHLTTLSEPRAPTTLCGEDLASVNLEVVDTAQSSTLWNELIERYHYLGYQPLPGAQIRYLVVSSSGPIGALGYGAAAWKVVARDEFIGWSPAERVANLRCVVNNARFLLLPWVTGRNLASRILALAARRLVEDWAVRYCYRPVLLETFVERERFRGTSYRAANWIHVGMTQGRGKLDQYHRHALPVKDIYVYPLQKDFRRRLLALPEPSG